MSHVALERLYGRSRSANDNQQGWDNMYLYSRGFRILRNVEESRRDYGEILRLVNDNAGGEMHAWASAFSASPNTIVFTAMVESRQDVMEATQKSRSCRSSARSSRACGRT